MNFSGMGVGSGSGDDNGVDGGSCSFCCRFLYSEVMDIGMA